MTLTTQEFADRLGISYTDANGLLRGLHALGLVEKAGVRKTPGARGKGKTLYKIPRDVGNGLDAKFAALETESEAA